MQAMSLGAADFAASMGMQTTGIGGTQENYYMLHEGERHYSDPWHWAQAAIVSACRTHGVLPVDGPFGDFSDDEGYRAQARRSPRWAWWANGRSTPSRSRWPTRSSRRPRRP
jgi:malyl-CoA/(S)-citramalyl-CoA lyase